MTHRPDPHEEMADQPRAEPLRVHVARLDPERHPSLQSLQSIQLREGPKSRREARYVVIRSASTGDVKHDSLTIKTFRRRQGDWREDVEHSLTLSSEGGTDELANLVEFIIAARGGAGSASKEYVVVSTDAKAADSIQRALDALSASQRVDALVDVIEGVAGDPDLLRALARRAYRNPDLFSEAAVSLNLALYHQAVQELKRLVESPDASEIKFQTLLSQNPWMFGSEYSEVLDRRRWTRDEQQDFVVRRTVDGYIELIEIKTPLNGAPLFLLDRSHNSHYPSAELSKVIGQVQKYIERLDADRASILAYDGEDTAKIRAKVIIGRTGDDQQRHALRRFNGHLHRIEVITFDQLLDTALNVTRYLRHSLKTAPTSR